MRRFELVNPFEFQQFNGFLSGQKLPMLPAVFLNRGEKSLLDGARASRIRPIITSSLVS